MAKLFNTTNQNIKGRLGNLVYYEFKGKTCIRTVPEKVKNPNSPLQQFNRNRFAVLGRLYQIFRPAIRFYSDLGSSNLYMFFFQKNMSNIQLERNEIQIRYEDLIFSNVSVSDLVGLRIQKQNKSFQFDWELSRIPENLYVLSAVFCKDLEQVYTTDVSANLLHAEVSFPEESKDMIPFVYAYRRIL